MEFLNEFTVSADQDTTWATLIDLERIAPCLPGARLDEVDGDLHRGRVRVKVGPVTLTYEGTARLVEVDPETRKVRISARGRETRGSGNAAADIFAVLTESGSGTRVSVRTELEITGKPAQFGSAVMQEVGTLIIRQFAERLERLIATGEPGSRGATDGSGQTIGGSHADEDVLDLVSIAGAATLKRFVPVVLGVLALGLLLRAFRD